ncbi:MAG TPA: MFS transporter [Pseudomonadales bacterium]|nr:MFS transporter [Pseudomonadales bacterium]
MKAGIYWRLSGFYFFYFIVLGTMVPYLPLYLQSLGLDAWHIGLLTSVMVGTKIVAPNVWGWLADHTGKRMAVIRFGCLMAVSCFSLIFGWENSIPLLALIIFLYSFFWNAVLAQFEAVTLVYLGAQPERYSRVRLWGSIGFITAVSLFGWLFDYVPLSVFPILVALGLLTIFLSSWMVTDPAPAAHQITLDTGDSFLQRLCQPQMMIFFSVCFLMVLSHGPYYTFFSLLMAQYNYSHTAIGLLWSLGVVAEVILFWFMHRLLPDWGVRNMLLVSLVATTLRWLLLAWFPQFISVMLFAQCLHAFSFAGFHAAAIETVRRLFSTQQSGKAQAFYSAVGYGAGNALGALGSGALWQISSSLPFICSALICLLAVVLVWRYLPAVFFTE